ncbi:MAG: hypothetical protein AB7O88_14410 [Reyranellaceae bacterium]
MAIGSGRRAFPAHDRYPCARIALPILRTTIRLLLCLLPLMALSPSTHAQGSPPPIGLWQGMNSGDYIMVQPNGACSASGTVNVSGSCSWSATSTGGVLTMTYQWTIGPARIHWSIRWLGRDLLLINNVERFARRG